MPFQQAVDTSQQWHEIHFEPLDKQLPKQQSIAAKGEILIPDHDAQYVVILH